MSFERWMMCAVMGLALAACDEPATPADSGTPSEDAGTPTQDAGIEDAGIEDAGIEDAGTEDAGGACACAAGEVCLAGVCVADCGGDAAAMEAALGDGLTPVANLCRAVSAVTVRGDQVWDVVAATEGTVTTFTLSRWTLDPPAAPSPVEVASATHDTGSAAVSTFPSGFVALSTDDAHAAFGYTTNADFEGGVFAVDTADGSSEVFDAPGNYAATFLGDYSFLFVNGLGLLGASAGEGVYAVDLNAATPTGASVLANMGSYSGSVEATADYVVAGGVDDAFVGTVWAVSRATVEAASAPLDVTTDAAEVLDPDGLAIPSTFRLVGDRLAVLPYGGPITSYATSWDGTALTLSEPRVVATGEAFTDVFEAPDGMVLVHAGGLLAVQTTP